MSAMPPIAPKAVKKLGQSVCVRSWASSSSDRGLVDPQSPPLAHLPRRINDIP
jgi:hypothetical protein